MDPQDVYLRLAEKGLSTDQIDYAQRLARIGVVVPFWPAYFRKHYGRDKSVKEILTKIEYWQKAIKGDFLIGDKIKSKIYRDIVLAKYATYHAILAELFPIQYTEVRFHLPGMVAKIVTISEVSSKSRECIEYMEEFAGRIEDVLDYELREFRKKAKEIGKLYDIVRGTQQHGPLYTKWLIPALYEYLFHFYETARHKMTAADDERELAYYPGLLMRDICDILLEECHDQQMPLTPSMVKGTISRYLGDKDLIKNIKRLLEHRFTHSGADIEEVLKLFPTPNIGVLKPA